MIGPLFRAVTAIAFLLAVTAPVAAHVQRFDLISRTDVPFGYERLVGKLHFADTPGTRANAAIVDLDLAPRNAASEVESVADVEIVRPKDASRSNGNVIVEINNRGGKGMVWHFDQGAVPSADPASAAYWGDGFLPQHGYTMMWIGWQFDVPRTPGNMALEAPVATQNGAPITGLVRSDFTVDAPAATHEIAHRGHVPYPVADENDPANVLTERSDVTAQRTAIPRSRWHFANAQRDIALDGGFATGKIYELVYKAKNPAVEGLGLAAERDAVAWLKHDPSAPVHVQRAYGYGISQSGRVLRTMLYDGFNADEQGRIVYDGVMSLVSGAALGGFDIRFGQPSRDGAAFSSFFYPVDVPPFDDATLLAHGGPSATGAKIMYGFTSHEYYGRTASLMTTDITGTRDLDIPPNVRLYAFMGGEHVPRVAARVRPGMRNVVDPLDYTWSERALLLALDAWVRTGAQPPASRYPRIADGTLIAPSARTFPALPGVVVPGDDVIHRTFHYDFGPAYPAAIAVEPPRVGAPYPVLVPKPDADGNDLGGLRLPDVAVPLATYTGWNVRTADTGFGDHLVDFFGSYFPFAPTPEARAAAHDPRRSIAERYANRDAYLAAYDATVTALVRDGYFLAADAPALHLHAAALWDAAVTPSAGVKGR